MKEHPLNPATLITKPYANVGAQDMGHGKEDKNMGLRLYPCGPVSVPRPFQNVDDTSLMYLHDAIAKSIPTRFETVAGEIVGNKLEREILRECIMRGIDHLTGTRVKTETIDLIPR